MNFEVNDIQSLTSSLSEGPFIDLALSSLTCKLYHEYGHLLAPIEAAIITSSHLTPATKLPPAAETPAEAPLEAAKRLEVEAPLEELKLED